MVVLRVRTAPEDGIYTHTIFAARLELLEFVSRGAALRLFGLKLYTDTRLLRDLNVHRLCPTGGRPSRTSMTSS